MGRKKTKGNRSPSGRLKKPGTVNARMNAGWDAGNDVVQRRRSLWAPIVALHQPEYYRTPCGELRQLDNTMDAIGQLFLLGLLTVPGYDPKALRDNGREYARLYWGYGYGSPASVANYDQRTSTSPSSEIPRATADDKRFKAFQALLRGLSCESQAMFDLVVAHEHTGLFVHWADDIIGRELLERGLMPAKVRFPTGNDYALLGAALGGLCALVDGQMPARHEQRIAA